MKPDLNSLKQSQQAKKKSLAEWRAAQLSELSLPSGLVVTLRNVTMTDLALTGKLPPAILDVVEQSNASADGLDLKAIFKNMADFRMLLDVLVTVAMVSPKIGATADDDHITLEELPNNDKMEIFNWINREVDQLKPFREGEAEPVAAA
jgi:hypothetical protein